MNTINTLNGVILASRDEVMEHAENTAMHLTEEERTTWNAKADASQLDTKADASTLTAHETNTTVHVSQEEKEKWNARTTKGVVAATQDGLDEHAENTTVHVTEEERTAWNNKTDASSIPPLLHRFGESLSLGSAVPAEYAAVGSDEVFSFRHTLLLGGIDHSETKEPVLSVTHPDKSGNYAFGSREVYDALMHPSCDNLHITSEERAAWNAKTEGPRYFELTLTEATVLLPEGVVWKNGDCFYVQMKPGNWGNSSNQILLTSFLSGLMKTEYNGYTIRVVFSNMTGEPLFLYGGAGDVEAPYNDTFCKINNNCYKVVTGVVCQGNVYCNLSPDLLH